jgi:diguanylate cyclase (GGDEF)-like protein
MAIEDKAAVETTVNAIFDSGFYQKIDVTNADGVSLFTTSTPPVVAESVPKWFISLMQITPPSMQREVSFQWRKVGVVHVQSRAGYAYEQLWLGAEKTLLWFVSLSLICVFLMSYLLRLILRPLKGVEEQATALSEKKYVEQTQIPKTRELKQVVEAMNRMVKRVQRMFDEQARHIEELRRTAYQDSLTGLANQRSTHAQMSDWLDYRKEFGPGTCIHLHIPNLQTLNEKLGEDTANNFIKYAGKQLSELSMRYQPNIVGRISGADFIALIPLTDEETLKREVSQLSDSIKTHAGQYDAIADDGTPVYLAITQSDEETSSAQLLSEARVASRQAIQENKDIFYPEEFTGTKITSSSWQEHVASAINNKQVFLQFQKVVSSEGDIPLQRELLARILNRDNIPCTALEFIHVVKDLGLIEALDKAVLERAIEYIQQHPEAPALTVNLSQQAIHAPNFDTWVAKTIAKHSLKGRLNIEINETAVLNDVEHVVQFRDMLRKHHIGFGVDNFGVHPSGFSYLYAVQPDYIKIDGSLSRHVDSSPEDKFFVSSLIAAAHSLGIKAYAERVERDSQVDQLVSINIDGTQGFLHGKPEALV